MALKYNNEKKTHAIVNMWVEWDNNLLESHWKPSSLILGQAVA